MSYKYLCKPCRNFCFSRPELFTHPKDGRGKIALATFVTGGTAKIIIRDLKDGREEELTVPKSRGGWDVLVYDNRYIIHGNCAPRSYLNVYDMVEEKWKETLEDPDNSYIWNLVEGSDGNVYGGTYPGADLVQYNPRTHDLKNMGRMTDYDENMYTNKIFSVDRGKYILLNCGVPKKHVVLYEVETQKKKDVFEFGDSVVMVLPEVIIVNGKDGNYKFYNPKDFSKIENSPYKEKLDIFYENTVSGHLKTTEDGKILGVSGQNFYIINDLTEKPDFQLLNTTPPATEIFTMCTDEDGDIWGATGLGQTIFKYDVEENEYTNFSDTTKYGGEIYGMVFIDKKLYISTYAHGEHIVYDPNKEWDTVNDINPKKLESNYPLFVRPEARSVKGPDNNFWTGWVANYGTYGGGVSRIDTKTGKMKYWYDPVKEQSVVSIDADDKYIYFTTGSRMNGLKRRIENHYLLVWDPEGNEINRLEIENKDKSTVDPRHIKVFDKYVIYFVKNTMHILSKDDLSEVDSKEFKNSVSYCIKTDKNKAGIFAGNMYYEFDVNKKEIIREEKLPGTVRMAAKSKKTGEIYFSHETKLYKLT